MPPEFLPVRRQHVEHPLVEDHLPPLDLSGQRDFVPIPGVDPLPPALQGVHFFGIVQYIGPGRTFDWIEFYRELFGTEVIPDEQRFGIMPKGKLLRAPALEPPTSSCCS